MLLQRSSNVPSDMDVEREFLSSGYFSLLAVNDNNAIEDFGSLQPKYSLRPIDRAS